MITPMEKVTILIFHKIKDDFLNALQKLGIIHITLKTKELQTEVLKDIVRSIERSDSFIRQSAFKVKNVAGVTDSERDSAFSFVQDYELLKQEVDKDSDQLEILDPICKHQHDARDDGEQHLADPEGGGVGRY